MGGGVGGGVGGGGCGGAGGGRPNSSSPDIGGRSPLPKMSFPRFDGENPRVWRDKCLDYFRIFNINPALWLTTATLHMDGMAALWLQSYKLTHEVVSWPPFMAAVEAEFGADDHRKFMKALLSLKQKGSVTEYQEQFQQLVYQVSIHNPHYDEQFFVSQFIKGLKTELRGAVESQVPGTLARAYLLAHVQQEIQEEGKPWRDRQAGHRAENVVARQAAPPHGLRGTAGDLWKDRQLRDFRRANGLCFRCGEKYDPAHQCARKAAAEVHALTVEEQRVELSDAVLNLIEMQDIAEAKQLSLSIHALSGAENNDTIRLRALVGNQIMLILVDSGSSHSFVNASMLSRIQHTATPITPTTVKVANGDNLQCDQIVPELSWWIQGHTFVTPMRVLALGAYDAILGVDWLKKFSPMTSDWAQKTLAFNYDGVPVLLQGLHTQDKVILTEVAADKLLQWDKGNEIWAMAVVHECETEDISPDHQPASITAVLSEFSDVFATPESVPPSRAYDHAISLHPDATPFNARPYRYSPAHKDEIERQVAAMLASGIIVQSMSPFASPVLLVQKKDGSWRFCIDYRRLNDLTIKNTFPMPVIDELLDELAGAQLFSKLDLRAGYHQIRMRPEDEAKTAFKTHQGHYQFRVMPFGLCNAPATFQCVMNSILQPCLRRSVLVFMDDILVYSHSLEAHVQHLHEVFSLLRKHCFFVKASKCSFARRSLDYLGHIISAEGVATDPRKTQVMQAWPRPTTPTELRGFLGLTGYYRKFVRKYGLLAKPLTNLLKKKQVNFIWSAEAETAFLALKEAMTSTPVLQLPNFQKQFIVETDACDTGIGAVLMQDSHPIAFLSKALSPTHQQLSIYEKEFLALIMAVERWRPYLQRGEFIIRTDHYSLSYLDDQVLQSPLQRKAMAKLMGLQFKICYKKGVENTAADSLSRVGHLLAVQACSEVRPAWVQEILNSYATDPEAQAKLTALAVLSPDPEGFALCHGLIRYRGRVWIGANSALQTKLIHAFHSSAVGGHSGTQATYHRIKRLFAWTGLKRAVTEFVQQCLVCQQAKHSNSHPAGLLQPLPTPEGAWRDITMDFVEGLPLSDGANVILVIVDRFTKYAHFVPLRHPFSAQNVARAFVDSVLKLHGMPRSIVSDRDKIFTSTLWKKLFAALGTKLSFTTAYHPQTDGQTERVNQCLEMFLRCAVQDSPKQWRRWLPLAEFWYNSTFHTSLGCSPFKALYGHDPNVGAMPDSSEIGASPAAEFLTERAVHLEILKKHLHNAQLRMKLYADRQRVERQFEVGDRVLLKLQPYAQASVVNRPYPKLAYKYFGPYTVLERIGQVAYKLELPETSMIHPVFHVSQLKEFHPDHTPVFAELPPLPTLDTSETVPEAVLDRRLVKKGNTAIPQALIKWSNIPAEAATWEDWEVLKLRFPTILTWGQVSSPGGADVTTLVRDTGKT